MGATGLFGGSALSPFPTSGGASDPFGGATSFGFSIPQGNPGEIEQAAGAAAAASLGFSSRVEDVTNAVSTASAGWEGAAQSAFAGYASHVIGVFNANADALERAGSVLSKFARDLEHAQQVTRQAVDECAHYQGEMNGQLGQAATHGQTAQTLSEQASLAMHPQMQGELNHQAQMAADQQQAATRAADAARGQLELWEKRGRDAYEAYTQAAHTAASEIQAAGGQLRSAADLAGGAPVPIAITSSDIAFARAILPVAAGVPASAWEDNPGGELQRLTGGEVTPGQVMALYQLAAEEQSNGQGSLIDAAGGFINTVTFGAVSFGDPNTARYRGGGYAAMIPIDPESLVVDADKAGVKLAAEDGSRIDYSEHFLDDLKDFTPTTASVHTGPLDDQLVLVQYYDKGGGGSYKWWTTTHDANEMPTVRDVMDKLALEPSWGDRNAVAVAHVPAGSDVTFLHGEAKPQETTPGEGIQFRFKDFDPKWIVAKRPLP